MTDDIISTIPESVRPPEEWFASAERKETPWGRSLWRVRWKAGSCTVEVRCLSDVDPIESAVTRAGTRPELIKLDVEDHGVATIKLKVGSVLVVSWHDREGKVKHDVIVVVSRRTLAKIYKRSGWPEPELMSSAVSVTRIPKRDLRRIIERDSTYWNPEGSDPHGDS